MSSTERPPSSKGRSAEPSGAARGIHPAILEDEGLPAAVASLARRAGIPVELEIAVDGRLPRTVETTAYFTVAESLTNVARYAHADSAKVSVIAQDEQLHIVVEDDGVGGADPTRGTGLRGLADRVGALDGRFDVRSPIRRWDADQCGDPGPVMAAGGIRVVVADDSR